MFPRINVHMHNDKLLGCTHVGPTRDRFASARARTGADVNVRPGPLVNVNRLMYCRSSLRSYHLCGSRTCSGELTLGLMEIALLLAPQAASVLSRCARPQIFFFLRPFDNTSMPCCTKLP